MEELAEKAYIFGTIFTLANKLQVLGDDFDKEITIKQWLFVVGVSQFQEPPTVSEVAHFIGYSRQNAKRIAIALNEAGFASIKKDDRDARALRILLSAKCSDYFSKRSQREIEFLQQLFLGFDSELSRNVYDGLKRLEQNIKDMLKAKEDKENGEENE